MMRWLEVVPGVSLALALALTGQYLASWIGEDLARLPKGSISPILVAILLGMILRNILGLPAWSVAGVRFALVRLLRLGIVLLGMRMSLADVGAIGLQALPVIVACVTVALLLVSWISGRLGLSRRLGTLIAAGTGICGATAIVALSPVIRARDEETAYAVACITLFGMLAMLAYPFVAHALFEGDAFRAGLFLGTSVHDTSQVVGSGLVYLQQYGDEAVLDAATVTKMVRNLGMLVVIPLLGLAFHRSERGTGPATPWYAMVPLFVVGFVLMSVVRTIGDHATPAFGILTQDNWLDVIGIAQEAAYLFLGVAMAAVGLGTSLRGLQAIGWRPFGASLLSALLVGGVSLGLIGLLY